MQRCLLWLCAIKLHSRLCLTWTVMVNAHSALNCLIYLLIYIYLDVSCMILIEGQIKVRTRGCCHGFSMLLGSMSMVRS